MSAAVTKDARPVTRAGVRERTAAAEPRSDLDLQDTIAEIGLPMHVVGGTVEERIERIVDIFDLPLVTPIEVAVADARDRVAHATAILQQDDRFKAAQRRKSMRCRLAYALRY